MSEDIHVALAKRGFKLTGSGPSYVVASGTVIEFIGTLAEIGDWIDALCSQRRYRQNCVRRKLTETRSAIR